MGFFAPQGQKIPFFFNIAECFGSEAAETLGDNPG